MKNIIYISFLLIIVSFVFNIFDFFSIKSLNKRANKFYEVSKTSLNTTERIADILNIKKNELLNNENFQIDSINKSFEEKIINANRLNSLDSLAKLAYNLKSELEIFEYNNKALQLDIETLKEKIDFLNRNCNKETKDTIITNCDEETKRLLSQIDSLKKETPENKIKFRKDDEFKIYFRYENAFFSNKDIIIFMEDNISEKINLKRISSLIIYFESHFLREDLSESVLTLEIEVLENDDFFLEKNISFSPSRETIFQSPKTILIERTLELPLNNKRFNKNMKYQINIRDKFSRKLFMSEILNFKENGI